MEVNVVTSGKHRKSNFEESSKMTKRTSTHTRRNTFLSHSRLSMKVRSLSKQSLRMRVDGRQKRVSTSKARRKIGMSIQRSHIPLSWPTFQFLTSFKRMKRRKSFWVNYTTLLMKVSQSLQTKSETKRLSPMQPTSRLCLFLVRIWSKK